MKPILLILLLTSAFASAETAETLLEQLRTAATAEAREARSSQDPLVLQRAYQWQELLAQLDRTQYSEQVNTELLRTIHSIEAAASSETLATLCRTLSTQLRAEQEKRDTDRADEMENAFREALRSGLAAKSFKDVDAPLAAVSKYARHSYDEASSARLRKLTSMGPQVWEFLRRWQDHLAGIDKGEGTTSEQRLRNLLNSTGDFSTLLPRSELLERLSVNIGANGAVTEKKWTQEEIDTKTREILGTIHTLDDVATAIGQLEDLQEKRSGLPGNLATSTIRTLNNVERTRRDLDKGLSTTLSLNNVAQTYGTDTDQSLAPVRAQLLLYALPRLLGVAEADKPQADESVSAYLHRMTLTARDRADWLVLQRAVDLSLSLRIEPMANTNDRTALQSLLAGVNQERAKQFSFAVISYEAALKAGSQLISAELIGEHLERIRKEHPEEYQQGVQTALTPPPVVDPRTSSPRP